MRVLLAHKFYHMTGGTEAYFRNLAAILESHGHHVIPFALQHPENPDTPYADYFLENLDYRADSRRYFLQNLPRILGRTLYSFEARRAVERLLRDHPVDVAHIQSIEHHISPSILHSFRRLGVPVVQSVNTYKLVCASYRLYRMEQQTICERCLYHKHYHAPLTRCVKNSLPGSLLAMVEMYLHDVLRIYGNVDRFIVPNRFMQDHLVSAGHAPEKIVRMLNPLDLSEYMPSFEYGDYILYFGRIDPEKGVKTLVQAMRHVPKMRLVVIGDGAEMQEIQEFIRVHGMENVELVGPKWGAALLPYLSGARLVVVPSVWYEPSPMVIYQSLAMGKPVLGAAIGGIPDLLTEATGSLFAPGDVDSLVDAITAHIWDEAWLQSAAQAARRWAELNLDPERYYDRINDIYRQVIAEKRG